MNKIQTTAARITLGLVVVATLAVAAPALAHHRVDHAGGPQPAESPTTTPPTETPGSVSPSPSDSPVPAVPDVPDVDDYYTPSPQQNCFTTDNVPNNSPGTGWGGALQPVSTAWATMGNIGSETSHDIQCLY